MLPAPLRPLLLLPLLLASPALAEEDAVGVYKQVAPRIVSLENVEGSGTGVILDSAGTILTNAHVVTSPLPFTVSIDAPGKDKPHVYKKVQILGMHPALDLALVKIDPKENPLTLVPVEIAKTKPDPGQRVYVIGNPGAGGKILTKTITSGLLSAVDREVDGHRYYQTDAAINPGNSGGPMCDRTGKVLGIITFKFNDADAVGFAIPLDKLDTKIFVDSSRRKGDAATASLLCKRGDKYYQLAQAAAKADGIGSEDHEYYQALAVYAYRRALIEDPGNPGLYYNIGMLFRTLNKDDLAGAYVMRCIQIDPWGNPLGDAYRELGLTYGKAGENNKALAVWREGVAKFPCSAKIWEDMSICHMGLKDFSEAAHAARMAILCADAYTRVPFVTKMEKDARGKLDAKALEALDARLQPAMVLATLKKAIDDSNAARKAKKLYMTPAFVDFIEKFGAPPIPGAEDRFPKDLLTIPDSVTKRLRS